LGYIERGQIPVEPSAPSFSRDIRPLFRAADIEAMAFVFDLSAYEDVREYAEEIFDRLADGTMPCDGRWSGDAVRRFREWIDGGMLR
jgi:hypothetical protein